MNRSIWIALAIALGLAGWLASGAYAPSENTAATEPVAETEVAALPAISVRVAVSIAKPVPRDLILYGRTEPHREVELRAETFGRVIDVPADQGDFVEIGHELLRLDPREREAMVAMATAEVRQRDLEQEASRKLGAKGFQADTQVALAEAELAAAEAKLREMQVDLEATSLKAPFSGLLEERYVEIGDYVDTADPLFVIIEQDPFLVTAEVPEAQRGMLSLGMEASIRLADGSDVVGKLTHVASRADGSTRTFKIELTVDNPGMRFPSGMTAILTLRRDVVQAHRLPASLLSLDGAGRLGLKVVEEDDTVAFLPVNLVKADADAVWLGDLPPRLDVIVVGQGYVHAGDPVTPTMVEEFGEGGINDVAQVSP